MTNPVRSRMTHRAVIERNTQSDANEYGHAGPPEWTTHIAAMPCFFYVPSARDSESVTANRTVVVERTALLAPLGTDVTERDRINGIADRAGTVLMSGIQNIRSVIRRHTHLEIVLQGAS